MYCNTKKTAVHNRFMPKSIKIEDVIVNFSDLKLHFNPFGGVGDEDLWSVFVEKPYSAAILKSIQSKESGFIELKAWHGRGKTTHLRYFHCFFPEAPILMLDQNKPKFEWKEGDLIFVDSIQHLSFAERLRILKTYKKVVATTHFPRILDCWIANKSRISFSIKGITENELEQMIIKRIRWAAYSDVDVKINPVFLSIAIKKYGDNARGILQSLYEMIAKKR